MIHRDIKPANILLDKRRTAHNAMGEPVLTDFGIAKLLGASTGAMSGSWLGTPLYIAPEQVQGYHGNERSDIYALGVILYEICTGVLPFQEENPTAIMMQHVNTMPALPNAALPCMWKTSIHKPEPMSTGNGFRQIGKRIDYRGIKAVGELQSF